MNEKSKDVRFVSLDGLILEGTYLESEQDNRGVAVLVHGGGVDRNEDGFYVRLANKLSNAGITSFRFDWRAHGQSQGTLEEMTLLGVVNDISAAVDQALILAEAFKVHLIGTSFGGGLSAYLVANFPEKVSSLVLMNPLLNYKRRLLEEKPFWHEGHLNNDGIEALNRDGWLPHGTVFRMSRQLINELFHIRPYLEMSKISVPTLTVHGTKDSMVPFDVALQYHKVNSQYEFLRIEGADHGFTVSGDEDYSDPQTIAWQELAFDNAVNWILKFN